MKGNNKIIIVLTLIVGMAIGMILKEVLFSGSDQTKKNSETAQTEHREHEESGEEEDHGEELARLSDEELQEFGVELAIADKGEIQQHVDLTGEIRIDPDRLAHITPRFPGIVREVRKKIGDRVKKGEVIAIIESNESLAPYEVNSLIDGTVIEMHLTKGEVISDASHDIVVADLSYVWADLNVYQKDLRYIDVGQPVEIFAGPKIPEVKGTISYISPVVDEGTRTAIARVVLRNSDRRWRPGLFVTGKVLTESESVPIAVPKTALQTFKDQTVVFVKTEEGFKPQPVSTGSSNRTMVEIRSGLRAGEQYAASGAFTLKADLMKESFGGGHGH